jgi:hypothetical protein
MASAPGLRASRGSRGPIGGSLRHDPQEEHAVRLVEAAYQGFKINQLGKDTGEFQFLARVRLDSSSVTAGVSFAW